MTTAHRYGVTKAGFIPKRLPEIFDDIAKDFREAFGEALDTSPNSVTGQEIGVLCKPIVDIWELGLKVYAARSYTGADGVSLDDLAAFRNIVRRGVSSSSCRVAMITDSATPVLIPTGTTVRAADTGKEFRLKQSRSINPSFSIYGAFEVPAVVVAGSPVSIQLSDIDGGGVSLATYTPTASDAGSGQVVADILAAVIGADPRFSVVKTERVIEVTAYDENYEFKISAPVVAVLSKYGTAGDFNAVEGGYISGSPHTVTEIVTPVFGLRGVFNPWDIVPGQGIEKDAELRQRIYTSRTTATAGTIDAIYEAIISIHGVSFCSVRENDKGSAVGDLPPHSIAVVFDGEVGIESEVAKEIWRTKPGGIQTAGRLFRTVTDKSGNLKEVRFSRPDYLPGLIKIKVTAYNPDAFPPADWKEKVAAAALSIMSLFPTGYDIPSQALFAAVYSVSGIGNAEVFVGKQVTPSTVVWTTAASPTLSVSAFERLQFDLSRVEVS